MSTSNSCLLNTFHFCPCRAPFQPPPPCLVPPGQPAGSWLVRAAPTTPGPSGSQVGLAETQRAGGEWSQRVCPWPCQASSDRWVPLGRPWLLMASLFHKEPPLRALPVLTPAGLVAGGASRSLWCSPHPWPQFCQKSPFIKRFLSLPFSLSSVFSRDPNRYIQRPPPSSYFSPPPCFNGHQSPWFFYSDMERKSRMTPQETPTFKRRAVVTKRIGCMADTPRLSNSWVLAYQHLFCAPEASFWRPIEAPN